MPDTSRAGMALRVALIGGALMAGSLSGCKTASQKELEAQAIDVLFTRARTAQAEGDPAGTFRPAETLLERELTPDESKEALYLAGRGRFLGGQEKKAFRHYEELIQDYPASQYLPMVEDDVFQVGRSYLAGEPGWLFGDLFSGRPFGVEVLRLFIATFTASDKADDALNLVAEYYLGREEFDFAADKYQMLVERYPGSEWHDLARYRLGDCHLRASRGAGYDDTLLRQARREFLTYLSRPAAYQEAAEVGLREAEESLARTQYLIARFYLTREEERGARIHLANALLLYPSTEAATDARRILEDHGWDTSLNTTDALVGRPGQAP